MTAAPETLPCSTPSAEGADARGVAAFVDAVEAAPGVEPHSLMVLRHGRVIAQGWWAPFGPGRRHLLYSLSKSFTSTAAGLAAAEGLLRFDDPVLAYFPELDAEITDPRSRSILVRHVAAMAAGHLEEQWGAALGRDHAEPVRGFLLGPPEREPGSVFAYSQPCTYTLGAIVQRVAGATLTEYLRPRLLDPLGIGPTAWQQHPAGRDLGFSGMYATTDAIARLGQLYLQRGVWDGRRLLPEEWVAEATRRQVATAGRSPAGSAPDWERGYGFQFWVSRHGYRGDGAYGQFCLVLPEQDAVVAITSASTDTQALLDLVWQHLVPALEAGARPGAGAEEADAALRRRLAGLALPPVAGEPAPPGGEAPWAGAGFRRADGSYGPRSLTGLRLDRTEAGWQAVFDEEGTPVTVPVATGGWAVTEGSPVPAAASGGWRDADTLRLDVVFLETPHRLALTCSLAAGTFGAQWVTTPLDGGRVSRLRAPA